MPPVVREVPFQKGDLTLVQVAGAPRLANAQLWQGGAESRWPGVRSAAPASPAASRRAAGAARRVGSHGVAAGVGGRRPAVHTQD